MPRKTPRSGARRRTSRARFNEAAARCRGKRILERTESSTTCLASMRPRPDAAENTRCTGTSGRSRFQLASMRPRPDAAENRQVRAASAGRPSPASMRPRPDAAENRAVPPFCFAPFHRFNEAAARCRGKRLPGPRSFRPCRRFNEAAARCRGKRQRDGDNELPVRSASMRPRPDAAENPRCRSGWQTSLIRFNEAAARCRGKRTSSPTSACGTRPGFNEAAARCRGKRPASPRHHKLP